MQDAGKQVAGQISRFLHCQIMQDLKHENMQIQVEMFGFSSSRLKTLRKISVLMSSECFNS